MTIHARIESATADARTAEHAATEASRRPYVGRINEEWVAAERIVDARWRDVQELLVERFLTQVR